MKFVLRNISINTALSYHSKVERFIDILELFLLKEGGHYVAYRASDSKHEYIEFQLIHAPSKYKDIKP